LHSGAAPAESFVTHRFPLARAREAFDLVAARTDDVLKAMIEL
jgi:threonine dehydrogenase-like Zn-dependent dehydrogenase